MPYRCVQDVDPAIRALIRHKARRLVGKAGFTPSDREDLEQELALQAHIASARYDAAKAQPVTFFNRVLDNRAASLLARAKAKRRDPARVVALEEAPEPVGGPDGTAQAALRLDVAEAVATLPPDLREVAHLLMERRVAEVQRLISRTREQVRQAQRRIGQHLRAAGLGPGGDFLDTRQPPAPPTAYIHLGQPNSDQLIHRSQKRRSSGVTSRHARRGPARRPA